MTKINSKIISKPQALLQTLEKICAKFQKDRYKIVWGVAITRYLLSIHLRSENDYRIRPNYRTVRLGFSKLLGTLSCGKICIYLLRIHYKKDQKKDLFDDDYVIVSHFLYKGICCGHSFELHRQVDAIQMSNHNICLYKEVKKKYTGCNLKTMEFLD